jgi:HK97 gp10 family phage protein
MAETVQNVKGLAALQRALDTLPARLESNVMRGALRAGARVFADLARAAAPEAEPSEKNKRLYGGRRGLLRDSIRVRVSLKNGQITARVVAGGKVGSAQAYYAMWVEKGTKPHTIRIVTAKGLNIGGQNSGGWVVTQVQHPGARPHPFMEPSFDQGSDQALRAVAAYVRKRLATKHGINVPESMGADAA